MRELIKKSRKNEEAKQKLLLELDTLTLDWEKSHGIPQVIKKHWRKHMGKFIVFCENEKHLLERFIRYHIRFGGCRDFASSCCFSFIVMLI
jgi:hypothetical protein